MHHSWCEHIQVREQVRDDYWYIVSYFEGAEGTLVPLKRWGKIFLFYIDTFKLCFVVV